MEDPGAAIHSDLAEWHGTGSLWTTNEKRAERGKPLKGKVLWEIPQGYEQATRDADTSTDTSTAANHTPDATRKTTQLLVTKTESGKYTLSINGLVVDFSSAEDLEFNERHVVKLDTFEGPYFEQSTQKAIVGPVSIGLLAATGQRPPHLATVSAVQLSYRNEDLLSAEVVQVTPLICGNEQSATLPVRLLPFPSHFTESPYIEIQDVDELQQRQIDAVFEKLKDMVSSMAAGAFFMTFFSGWAVWRKAMAIFIPKWLITEPVGKPPNEGLETTARLIESFGPILDIFQVPKFKAFLTGAVRNEADIRAFTTKSAVNKEEKRAVGHAKLLDSAMQPQTTTFGAKIYRKYTIRSITRILRSLMKKDEEKTIALINKDTSDKAMDNLVRPTSLWERTLGSGTRLKTPNQRDEYTFLQYLIEDAPSKNVQSVSNKLQWLGIGPAIGMKKDRSGMPQMGLFLPRVGQPKTRGIDFDILRKDRATTAIDIDIVDSTIHWKVRIISSLDVGFRAGYIASGLSDELKDLKHTIREFKEIHETRPGINSGTTRAVKIEVGKKTGWYQKIGEFVNSALESTLLPYMRKRWRGDYHNYLVKGAEKFYTQTYEKFDALEKVAGQGSRAQLVVGKGTIDFSAQKMILRVRPQRVNMQIVTFPVAQGDHVGISVTDELLQETGSVHPLNGAVDELKRSSTSYTLSLNALWSRWECKTGTRMMWYDVFKQRQENEQLGTAADATWNSLNEQVVKTIGTSRVSFTADGILLPIEVRDRMVWWSEDNASTQNPALANAVRLISTKPATTFRGTKEERAQAHVPANAKGDAPTSPATVAELVAAHALADSLIARTVVRQLLPDTILVSTNAVESLRVLVPRIKEIIDACRATNTVAPGGVFDANDPIFACIPGGVDAARLLHCLGAWKRREYVTLAVDGSKTYLQVDDTAAQHLARHNIWTLEADTQLNSVLALLSRISMSTLAAMPVYALQNALSSTTLSDETVVNARLCEAMASFTRTNSMATAFRLNQPGSDLVKMRIVAHWPVLFAVMIQCKKSKEFVERMNALKPGVERLNALARAQAVAHHETALDVATFQLRNSSLCVDRAHFFGDGDRDRGHCGPSNRSKGTYFVPFAHGSAPHSRVWSTAHPGSRGLDSVPVARGAIDSAMRDLDLKQVQGGTATASRTVSVAENGGSVKGDHPFCLQLLNCDTDPSVECHLVTPTVVSAVDAFCAISESKPSGTEQERLASATQSLLQGNGNLEIGSIVDVICWNAERLVQSALLVVGNSEDAYTQFTLVCKIPESLEMLPTLQDVMPIYKTRTAQISLLRWELNIRLRVHRAALYYAHIESLRLDFDARRKLLTERLKDADEGIETHREFHKLPESARTIARREFQAETQSSVDTPALDLNAQTMNIGAEVNTDDPAAAPAAAPDAAPAEKQDERSDQEKETEEVGAARVANLVAQIEKNQADYTAREAGEQPPGMEEEKAVGEDEDPDKMPKVWEDYKKEKEYPDESFSAKEYLHIWLALDRVTFRNPLNKETEEAFLQDLERYSPKHVPGRVTEDQNWNVTYDLKKVDRRAQEITHLVAGNLREYDITAFETANSGTINDIKEYEEYVESMLTGDALTAAQKDLPTFDVDKLRSLLEENQVATIDDVYNKAASNDQGNESPSPNLKVTSEAFVEKETEFHDANKGQANAQASLKVKLETQSLEFETMQLRNEHAFYASVVLAGAILKSLLGEKDAPKLRIAGKTGSQSTFNATPEQWKILRVKPSGENGEDGEDGEGAPLSLFEAAVVLEQFVLACPV